MSLKQVNQDEWAKDADGYYSDVVGEVDRMVIHIPIERFTLWRAGDGVSVSKGVLVLWDGDLDSRVLDFVDRYSENGLCAVMERKAVLFCIWHPYAVEPPSLADGYMHPEGDYWSVENLGNATMMQTPNFMCD